MTRSIDFSDFPNDTAFASDLGWRPGQFPKVINVGGHEYKTRYVDGADGEVWSVKYASGSHFLTVYND